MSPASLPTPLPVLDRIGTELQIELPHSLGKFRPKLVGLRFPLEPKHDIVRKAHRDHVTVGSRRNSLCFLSVVGPGFSLRPVSTRPGELHLAARRGGAVGRRSVPAHPGAPTTALPAFLERRLRLVSPQRSSRHYRVTKPGSCPL